MKRKYEKPNMDLEMFEANEYIATCWALECNVGNTPKKSGYAYRELNNTTGYQSTIPLIYKGDKKLDSGYGCGTPHIVKSEPTINAMWDEDPNENNTTPYAIHRWGDSHFTRYPVGGWDSIKSNHS